MLIVIMELQTICVFVQRPLKPKVVPKKKISRECAVLTELIPRDNRVPKNIETWTELPVRLIDSINEENFKRNLLSRREKSSSKKEVYTY